MYVEQLYTNCLAEAAYYIESEGQAAIIDPLRETAPYLELAKKRNATIKYIFETHFHADFVSGHVDLAKKTGAAIVYGPTAKAAYNIVVAKDGETFPLGKVGIKVLHTPGHTMESSCFLLIDDKGKEHAVFTGDTLFVGDVGRPDLAVKSDLTQEDLAGYLYESLQTKIKTLPDQVIVYPGHGAGSACGKNIGKETYSTIGQQKQSNYALQSPSKEQFIKEVTEGLTEPPKYFFMDAAINKNGYDSIDDVMAKNTKAIEVSEFDAMMHSGILVLDTRDADSFEKGFIPGSLNIGLNGQYAPWVGAMIDGKAQLLLVTEEGKEAEAVLRLARVGYENVKGYLKGGIAAWMAAGKKTDTVNSVEPQDFVKNYDGKTAVLDIRNPGEWTNTGVIDNARLIPLAQLERELGMLDKAKTYYVHCAGGYRSMMGASLMKKHGFTQIINVKGGINKLIEFGQQVSAPKTAKA